MNLLFAIDKRYVPLLLDCLWSISEHGGAETYDAYILHSDLENEDILQIRTHVAENMKCYFIDVPQDIFSGFPVTKRYPKQIYYRLGAPVLLPSNLERILYLDVDTLVINSLMPLYESDFGDTWFMACTHTREFLSALNRIRLGIGKEKEIPYINTGVMMLNLQQLREHFDLEAIRQYAVEKQHALLLPDQDILTALYGKRVKLLDSMTYNLSDRTLAFYNADSKHEKVDVDWVRKNSVIIHYFGKNKPWNSSYSGILDIFYYENIASRAKQRTNCKE